VIAGVTVVAIVIIAVVIAIIIGMLTSHLLITKAQSISICNAA
jgi:hypothetical protein